MSSLFHKVDYIIAFRSIVQNDNIERICVSSHNRIGCIHIVHSY